MELAEPSVELGSRDQLDHDYQVDFDSNAGAEMDGFDFGLDTGYDQTENPATEVTADNVPATDIGPKSNHQEQENGTKPAAGNQPRAAQVSHDAASNAGADVDDQSEIGYEDEDGLETPDINADVETTEPAGTEHGLPLTSPDHQPEPAQSDDECRSETLEHEKAPALTEDAALGEDSENIDPQGEYANADYDEDADSPMEDRDLTADGLDDETMGEYSVTDRHEETHPGLSELDREFEDLAHSLYADYDIEVLYNNESYALVGAPDDDPDNYFLSDPKELDHPLSQFLSALRGVISNEVSSTDELVVRFEPLGLEFGERSSEKFLSRSFREILDCHATLAAKDDSFAAEPVIHLVVRRDSEEHFLALLAEADLDEADQPNHPDDREESVAHSEVSHVQSPDDSSAENPPSDNEYSGEYHASHGDAAGAATQELEHEQVASEHENVQLTEASSDHHDPEGEHEHNAAQADAGSFEPRSPPLEDVHRGDTFEDGAAEAHPEEPLKDVDGEGNWTETAAEAAETASQQAEMPAEMSEEQPHQDTAYQDNDGSGEVTEFQAADSVSATENGGPEQGTTSNDDDLILTFDDELEPSTNQEEDEDEKSIIADDAIEGAANEVEGVSEPLASDNIGDSTSKDFLNESHVAATAVETASVQTSTTFEGDEIDYDEQHVADDSFTHPEETVQQSTSAPGTENDEIDWNDEEDEEQHLLSLEEGGENDGSKEVSLTPSSIAGKRNRTDETESLADETDYKRRRT
ncbi:hypothetical protein VTK26DRAFT_4034 [Humicola hyalothermophila]